MYDYFDDMFEKLRNSFTRPVMDQKPFSCYETDGGFIITVNTLGIDPKNLNISLSYDKGRVYPTLKIKGETSIDSINFTNKVDLALLLKIDSKIKDIQYKSENGLTRILVKLDEPEVNTISAHYVGEDKDSTDW